MPHARLAQVGAGIDAEEGHNGIVVRGVVGGLIGGVTGGIVSSKVAGVPADWWLFIVECGWRRLGLL